VSKGNNNKQDGGIKLDRPNDRVEGQSVTQWTEDWIRWVAHAPADRPVATPFEGATPASPANAQVHNNGDVFFLAGGNWGNSTNPAVPRITVDYGKPILMPLINFVDTEGPMIESIPNFVADHRGSFADEARYVTSLATKAITDAHLTVTKVGDSKPLIDIHGKETAKLFTDTGLFALGTPRPNEYLGSLVEGVEGLKNLPYTEEVATSYSKRHCRLTARAI
jgi:hypothetical protein